MRAFSATLLLLFAWTGSVAAAIPAASGRCCVKKHKSKPGPLPRLEKPCCCDDGKQEGDGCGCQVSSRPKHGEPARAALHGAQNARAAQQVLALALLAAPLPVVHVAPASLPDQSAAPPGERSLEQSPKRLC